MKHEKALLVGLSYTIGFTAAFISFGLPQLKSGVTDTQSYTPTAVSVADYASEGTQAATAVAALNETSVGLFINVAGEDRIISQKVDANAAGLPGAHVAVHGLAVSPDGQFAHYCEQVTEVPTECAHYIYKVSSHSIAAVKIEGAPLRSDIASVQASWNAAGNLSIGEYQSVNPAEPWFVQ